MKRPLTILAALLVLGMLAGCASPTAPSVSEGPTAASGPTVPQPEPGKATITGQIISSRTGQPLASKVVRLAPVTREGFEQGDGGFILNEATSPGARIDATGHFVIANIPAAEYVMIISNDMGNNAVVTLSSGKAQVWKADAGKVLDVGSVKVDGP